MFETKEHYEMYFSETGVLAKGYRLEQVEIDDIKETFEALRKVARAAKHTIEVGSELDESRTWIWDDDAFSVLKAIRALPDWLLEDE